MLRRARHGRHHWDQLDSVQREHQRMFAALYPSHTRPEHHHRLHLPAMYQRHGCAVACWGVEASHQNYKGTFADVLRQFLQHESNAEAYSKNLLPRLLLRAVEAVNDRPFLPTCFQLLRPFEKAEVQRLTGLQNVQIAQKCQLQLQEVAEGDLLLWTESLNRGGKIHFFLCKEEKLYVYVSILQAYGPQETVCYKKSNRQMKKSFWHGTQRATYQLGRASKVMLSYVYLEKLLPALRKKDQNHEKTRNFKSNQFHLIIVLNHKKAMKKT